MTKRRKGKPHSGVITIAGNLKDGSTSAPGQPMPNAMNIHLLMEIARTRHNVEQIGPAQAVLSPCGTYASTVALDQHIAKLTRVQLREAVRRLAVDLAGEERHNAWQRERRHEMEQKLTELKGAVRLLAKINDTL